MKINHVSKTMALKRVVHNISEEIKPGKLTAFIGPNGAGKSTLLAMMSRLIEKNTGEILVNHQEIKTWDQTKLAQKLAILKQANNVQLKITVRELVSFGRFPYSQGRLTTQDEQKITEALHYLNLSELENEAIDTLSGGQLQRVYIAMVLAQDTDYLFLDEPLNNLDMNHAVSLMQTMRRLVDEEDKTIVIVLHDINFASSYADEIIAMKNGEIFKSGPTDEVITKETLDQLYEMDIKICELEGKRFCLYFNN